MVLWITKENKMFVYFIVKSMIPIVREMRMREVLKIMWL